MQRVFGSGWTDRPTDRLYFLTLTAPSEIGGHTMPSGDVCPCTPLEGINLAEWHATAGKRWNTFITELRRKVGYVQYCKAAEIQQGRGAVHFHALLRLDSKLNERLIRRLAIEHGFGHSVKLDHLGGAQGSQRAAAYCAKYASKAAGERDLVAWLDLRTGEVVTGAPRLRVWTASRGWGLTMKQVKLLQAKWARAVAAGAEAPASPTAGPPRPPGLLSIVARSGAGPTTSELSP